MATRVKRDVVAEAEAVVKEAVETVEQVVEDKIEQVEELVKEETVFDAFIAHQRRALDETGKALRALIPKAAEKHGKAAYDEVVESYRSLVNSVVDELLETIEKMRIAEPEVPPKARKPRDPKLN